MKSIKQQFIKYVAQNILGMLGISIYILADTFFISVAEGANGLTVLNLSLPVYGIIFALGAMVGIGASIRYSLDKAKNDKCVDFYFSNAIFWNLIISIPFVLAGLLSPKSVLYLMGADYEIAELGVNYVRIFMSFSSFFMLNYTFNAFVRNDNAPTIGMLASLSGSLFNIIFDYIFMFPLKMGLLGAALATGISPLVSILVTFTHYLSKRNNIRFKIKAPSINLFLKFSPLGFASFIGELSSAITTIVFNFLILGLIGNIGIAAYGVIANFSLVAMAIFNGLSQGAQPLISKYHGKGEYTSVKSLTRLGLCSVIILEAVLIALSWCFTDQFISIFNSGHNIEMASIAHIGLRLYFLGYIFAGINVFLISCFAAKDEPAKAFAGSISRGVVTISLCSIILSKLIGINGVWLSFLASEVITFIFINLCNRKA